jgi:hypothetical protein
MQTRTKYIHTLYNKGGLAWGILMVILSYPYGERHQEDPVFYAWAFLGMVNNFVGRTRIEASGTAGIARRLVNLFLSGAIRSRVAKRTAQVTLDHQRVID